MASVTKINKLFCTIFSSFIKFSLVFLFSPTTTRTTFSHIFSQTETCWECTISSVHDPCPWHPWKNLQPVMSLICILSRFKGMAGAGPRTSLYFCSILTTKDNKNTKSHSSSSYLIAIQRFLGILTLQISRPQLHWTVWQYNAGSTISACGKSNHFSLIISRVLIRLIFSQTTFMRAANLSRALNFSVYAQQYNITRHKFSIWKLVSLPVYNSDPYFAQVSSMAH